MESMPLQPLHALAHELAVERLAVLLAAPGDCLLCAVPLDGYAISGFKPLHVPFRRVVLYARVEPHVGHFASRAVAHPLAHVQHHVGVRTAAD